eukprot:GEMP01022587.1.p1 GENE.GEMP01022587.1~~GEMP01022587.1.p1  ORF type:complete len:813 (+),score=136.93 GEMP01022587.1:26-2440(+)
MNAHLFRDIDDSTNDRNSNDTDSTNDPNGETVAMDRSMVNSNANYGPIGGVQDSTRLIEKRSRSRDRNDVVTSVHVALIKAREGLLDEAYTMAKRVGTLEPNSPEKAQAEETLGMICTEQGIKQYQKGDKQKAMEWFQEARNYRFAPGAFHIGVIYSDNKNYSKAREMYEEATKISPRYLEAWNNLGVTLRHLDLDGEQACRHALAINPICVKTRENLAVQLVDRAVKLIRQEDLKGGKLVLKEALSVHAFHGDAFFNLGVLYGIQNKYLKAKLNYELALNFSPNHAMSANNLAVLLRQMGQLEEAVIYFQKALTIQPKMGLANKNFGALCGALGRMDDAMEHTTRAIDADPNDAEAHNNLALMYRDTGEVDKCVEYLKKCAELCPDNKHVHSNMLMTLNYLEEPREQIYEQHKAWAKRFETASSPKIPPVRPAGRPLRVGYVSPDFYYHSVSYFVQAPLEHHSDAIQVYCYSDVVHEDAKSRLFRSFANVWRTILGKSDEEVAELVRSDEIDILVDLAGHTGYNRLQVFAMKPAPIQITWIGYPNTTGLREMDYRMSDAICDPPDTDPYYVEKILRLPCFLCYTPNRGDGAAEAPIPVRHEGPVTFGCFNTLAKVNATTVKVWCKILECVPEARLFLKSKALSSKRVQERYRQMFGKYADRLALSGLMRSPTEHMTAYSLVDVALDTFPYSGTTTTCEALYMGVPVVTLRADRKSPGMHAQNVSASLLTQVGLEDLVCKSHQEYVDACVSLVRDTKRLKHMRTNLRQDMLASPLCDGKKFCAQLETLYTGIFDDWSRSNERTN